MLEKIGLRLKIDVTKIKKELLFRSVNTKSIYLDCTTFINIDTTDQFGNNCFVSQDLPSDQREKNNNGQIIGNGKIFYRKEKNEEQQKELEPTNNKNLKEDDIPF